jgi:transglutaminase-like putative cysteine protease
MRLRIRHAITATYEEPASLVQRSLRISPRTFNGQYVRAWRVEVDDDCRQTRSTDAFGNITHEFSILGAVRSLVIVASGEVEVDDTAGILTGSPGDRMPPAVYLRESPLTAIEPEIRAFAAEVKGTSEGELDVCHRLMRALYQAIEPAEPEPAELLGVAATPAATCLAAGQGTPVDVAHLFIAAARSLSIPARFVTGYVARPDAAGGAHAWAETLVPGLGWVGFDVFGDTCPTERYVRIASAIDEAGASLLRRADRGGSPPAVAVACEVVPLA